MTTAIAAGWRGGLPKPLIEEIERAIRQLDADEVYEKKHGNLSETIKYLKDVGFHSEKLKTAIIKISPQGLAAIHEEGRQRGIWTGRYELAKIAQLLELIPDIALDAAERLLVMHSPLPDHGQGAGSAIGRDSDLRAIRAEHGRKSFSPEFRSPKDKFGVAVLKAYLRHTTGFDVTKRGASRELDTFLALVWSEISPNEPANWKRLVHARHEIASIIAGERYRSELRKQNYDYENASSPNLRRSPLKETSPYAVAPDQPGAIDVDAKGKRGG